MASQKRQQMLDDLNRYSAKQATVTHDRLFHANYLHALRRLDNEQLAKEWKVYCG